MYLSVNTYSFGERLLQAFSWMLVHSLWQGMLLALIAVALLQLMRKAGSARRYNMVLAHFLLLVLTCIITFFRELAGFASAQEVTAAGSLQESAATVFRFNTALLSSLAVSFADLVSANAPLLVIIWAALFSIRSLRMIQGLRFLQHARQRQVYKAPAMWQQRVQQLCDTLGVLRTVQLLESTYIKVPMVAGHLKPVILMPAGLLTGLPPAQIEAVLLHELAHIGRHDYLINLVQTCLETFFFFNPGVLWLSSILRDEREHCCDDVALQQTGSKKTFIQALVSFKEYTLTAQVTAVAFPGSKNQLLQRVSRIINNQHQAPGTGEKACFFIGLGILCIILSAAAMTYLHPDSRTTAEAPALLTQKEAIITLMAPPKEKAVQAPVYKTIVKSASQIVAAVPASTVLPPARTSVPVQVPIPTDEQDNMYAPVTEEAADNTLADIARQSEEQLRRERAQLERYRHQAALDRLQAERDRKQADKDREQARLDRIQADKDRMQADQDRKQALIDRQQAIMDRNNAERERREHARAAAQYELQRKAFYQDRYSGTTEHHNNGDRNTTNQHNNENNIQ
ncbi:M56 family metallopeptidase [Chitinophaga rhizophila]|uniref:M48 family metalloprotease n=1 Tax=Chitinophaga rhizophila TaxID=2866212 RepID=A0ABS7G6H2_9BACT|nr:M56 family metallopeptidase [Chitinophaga rhizophila]MBW8683214.1 M48 family metalloprotease [Chitinophaga rhizophila]